MSELDQFGDLFASEREFQQTLLQLLGKLDGVTGVRLLQGPTERGKDIVFYHQGPFGAKRLVACVVKNTPISGSVGSNAGARTVLLQCQQAFDSPYTNATGQEERVEHVYVISPHSTTADAMDSIKGALQQRSGQVTFLCGSDLVDVFRNVWPTFLAFNGDFIGKYLNDLRLRLDANPISSALSLRHSIIAPATRMLSTVYVPQTFTVQISEYTERPLSWYPDLLASRTSLAEVQDAQFNFAVLCLVLTNSTLWQPGPEALAWYDNGRLLGRVSKALPELWERAYKDLVHSYKGDQLPSKATALVQLAPDTALRNEYRDMLGAARNCWSAFRRRLADERSECQLYPKDALATITHPAYPRHCAIAEVATRAYLAIAKTFVRFNGQINADDLSRLSHSLLITAPAGFGKTSFCQYHALRDADNLLKHEDDVLPVYVPLHEISRVKGVSFGDFFLRSPNLRQVIESGECDAVPFRRIRLYLDGLDEVPDNDLRQTIILEALSAPIAWPLQVIITARGHVYDSYLTTLPRVALSAFSGNELHKFISRWLEDDPNGVVHLEGHLKRNAAVHELATIPLIGTILIGVYRKLRQIPETRVALYEACVDLLCGGWDLVKNVQRGGRYAPPIKMTVLKTLAGQLHARRLRHADPDDVQRALSFSLNRLEPQHEAIVDEIVQDGLLARSGKQVMFCHLSFQEFLAAKDLTDPTGRKPGSALRQYLLGDDWWKEVVAFYIGLLNDPYAAHEWIGSIVRGIARAKGNSVDLELKVRSATLERTLHAAYPDFAAKPILTN